jgi:transcriptional regulator with XRE-family HTH domain
MLIQNANSDEAVLAELGARLRGTRLERNLSQERLAEEAGVGRVTLQRIEAGESPSFVNLVRVLRALDLLGGLNALVPEPAQSPIDELRRQGRRRQRAGSPRNTEGTVVAKTPHPFRWGEEKADRP